MEIKRYEPAIMLDEDGYAITEPTITEYEHGGLVLFSDVEKALKLWEIVRIPKGKECNTCQLEKASDGHTWCPYFKGKYGVGELEYKNGKPIRHQQCLDMFGEE